MDYEIKPVCREQLRLFARFFRSICGVPEDVPIDPVALLDRLPDLEGFGGVRYDVVCDDALPGNVPAQCIPTENGYLIQVKESVYLGASERRVGGHRMHIMHEISHVFLDKLGYKPIFTRCVANDTMPYRKLEWAVKALAGEIMMPYEYTVGLSEKEIMESYGVSSSAAKTCIKYQKVGGVHE